MLWTFFIYLYFICSLIETLCLFFLMLQCDAWSLKNWYEIEITEQQLKTAYKIGLIICLTPVSIFILIIFVLIQLKQKTN